MPLLDLLFSVIAPHACLVCQKDGKLLCAWCALDAFEPVPSRCYHCKRLTNDFATCPACRRRAPLRHVWVKSQYMGVSKQILHSFKFERARSAAPIIANAMIDILPYLPERTVLVPVPTATSRVRQRGYDQTLLLVKNIVKKSDLHMEIAIVRLTQSRQVGADRQKRLKQLESAFYVSKPSKLKDRDILLIDDVATTGATLEIVARELKRSGAKSVSALVFAQKQ